MLEYNKKKVNKKFIYSVFYVKSITFIITLYCKVFIIKFVVILVFFILLYRTYDKSLPDQWQNESWRT